MGNRPGPVASAIGSRGRLGKNPKSETNPNQNEEANSKPQPFSIDCFILIDLGLFRISDFDFRICYNAGKKGVPVSLPAVAVSQSPEDKFREYLASRPRPQRFTDQQRDLVRYIFSQHNHFDADQLIDRVKQEN